MAERYTYLPTFFFFTTDFSLSHIQNLCHNLPKLCHNRTWVPIGPQHYVWLAIELQAYRITCVMDGNLLWTSWTKSTKQGFPFDGEATTSFISVVRDWGKSIFDGGLSRTCSPFENMQPAESYNCRIES